MAERRMISKKIVDADAFMDMPLSTQALYLHLAVRADDDGFIGNPKKIARMIGANDDDYKVLLTKRFILQFPNGICVIKHWLIHNYIQNDRYKETQYLDEKKLLKIKDNKAYTECIQNVSSLEPQVRLGKDRIGKDTIHATINVADDVQIIPEPSERKKKEVAFNPLGSEIIDAFAKTVNPSCSRYYGNKTQRSACDGLITTYGLEKVLKAIEVLPQTNKEPFFPKINTPLQLFERYESLKDAWHRNKKETEKKKPKEVII